MQFKYCEIKRQNLYNSPSTSLLCATTLSPEKAISSIAEFQGTQCLSQTRRKVYKDILYIVHHLDTTESEEEPIAKKRSRVRNSPKKKPQNPKEGFKNARDLGLLQRKKT